MDYELILIVFEIFLIIVIKMSSTTAVFKRRRNNWLLSFVIFDLRLNSFKLFIMFQSLYFLDLHYICIHTITNSRLIFCIKTMLCHCIINDKT